jgi:hypothetical protein
MTKHTHTHTKSMVMHESITSIHELQDDPHLALGAVDVCPHILHDTSMTTCKEAQQEGGECDVTSLSLFGLMNVGVKDDGKSKERSIRRGKCGGHLRLCMAISLRSSSRYSIGEVLTAQAIPVLLSMAWKTVPLAPWPSFLVRLKRTLGSSSENLTAVFTARATLCL